MPEFLERLRQRRQVLMQSSMKQVAMQQAIAKHHDDIKHPSEELREAMQLAKVPTQPVPLKPLQLEPVLDPHPHVLLARHNRVADQARRSMQMGMEIHHLAVRMGLAADPEESMQAVLPASSSPSASGRFTPAAAHAKPAERSSEAAGRFMDTLAQLKVAQKVLEVEAM